MHSLDHIGSTTDDLAAQSNESHSTHQCCRWLLEIEAQLILANGTKLVDEKKNTLPEPHVHACVSMW